MKVNIPRAAFVAIVMCTANLAVAQDIVGDWVAIPAGSGALRHLERLILKLSKDRQGTLSGTMYAGNIGDTLFTIAAISVSGPKLSFVMQSAGSSGTRNQASIGTVMSFSGAMSGNGKSIVGWVQSAGLNERLKFDRVGKVPTAKAPPEKAPTPDATGATSSGGPPASPADSSALLSRALEKLAGTKRQLLKYTCLETIERSFYSAPAAKVGTNVMNEVPPQSCTGRTFSLGHLDLTAEDRLRMEVAVADGKEIDSWASAGSFDSRSIHDVVSTGHTSTGAFGTGCLTVLGEPRSWGQEQLAVDVNYAGYLP